MALTARSFLNSNSPLVYGIESSNYSTVEYKTKLFLEKPQHSGNPPIYTLPPTEARKVLSGLQASSLEKVSPAYNPPAEIENKSIPACNNGEIYIQIVKPQGSGNKTLPVVMLFHGGGWVLGGFDTHERLLKELANDADAAIVFVNFTPPLKQNICRLLFRRSICCYKMDCREWSNSKSKSFTFSSSW